MVVGDTILTENFSGFPMPSSTDSAPEDADLELKEQALLLASLRCDDSFKPIPPQKSLTSPGLTGPRSKRRGRAQINPPEHVCFACLGHGELIRCAIRDCLKAYHPNCIGKDSEAFQTERPWFCGWHFCTHCSEPAAVHCYTCQNAVCNNCTKEADFLCLRESRGLCNSCLRIVKTTESGQESVKANGVQVDLNDKETYEYLYKDYWENLKSKTYLTWEEIEKAQKSKEASELLLKNSHHGTEQNDGSDTDSDDVLATKHQYQLKRKRLSSTSDVDYDESGSDDNAGDEEEDDDVKPKRGWAKRHEFDGWASRELLDFFQSMKEDTKKPLSLIAAKKLLLSYIKDNKLQHPQRRGQIICDEKLQKLFSKKSMECSEMKKLLSSHIASKRHVNKSRESQATFDDNITHVEERGIKGSNEKQRKLRKKLDETKSIVADPNDFAAISVKNINLLYLTRPLLEDLLNDPEFNSKVLGAFVRIRVPGMANKNDACHRLVQVVGIKFQNPVNSVAKMADVVLEVLNLQKREEVSANVVSKQDFTEEECQRLRQCIKCGFIKAMTVGEMEEKARSLQEVKCKSWFDAELRRLSHLRDRASEKGYKRELRECLEKLHLLCSAEEKERRLKESLQITGDAHMDPDFDSDFEETLAKEKQGKLISSDKGHASNKNSGLAEKSSSSLNEVNVSSGIGDSAKIKSFGWGQKDFGRDIDYRFPFNLDDMNSATHQKMAFENMNWNSDMRRNKQRDVESNNWSGFLRSDGASDQGIERNDTTLDLDGCSGYGRSIYGSTSLSESLSAGQRGNADDITQAPSTVDLSTPAAAIDEKENIWHYKDPTGKVQGPFSMEQLRKWEKTKLFPLDLKVWKISECEDKSILLTDALAAKHSKNLSAGSALQSTVSLENNPQTGCNTAVLGGHLKEALMAGNIWREQSKVGAWDQDEMLKASSQNAHKDCIIVNKLQECTNTESGNDREKKYDLNVASENFKTAEAWGPGKAAEYGGWNMSRFSLEDRAQGNVEFRTSRDSNYYRDVNRSWNDRPRPEFRNFRRKDIPCKYFARGSCKKGLFCDFRHDN